VEPFLELLRIVLFLEQDVAYIPHIPTGQTGGQKGREDAKDLGSVAEPMYLVCEDGDGRDANKCCYTTLFDIL
jgi:hypothetical protein